MNGRRLIHIPIIHTEVDMGSLAESLKKKYIQSYGVHKWRHHLKKIDELWTNIENCLEQKHLCYPHVKYIRMVYLFVVWLKRRHKNAYSFKHLQKPAMRFITYCFSLITHTSIDRQ